jgi:S1-C subfamily serine protease
MQRPGLFYPHKTQSGFTILLFMELTRRILVALTIFTLAIVTFLWLQGQIKEERYGLTDLLHGEPRPDDQHPHPSQSDTLRPLRPEDVALLSQLDHEYAQLAQRVIPAVVSISTVRSHQLPTISGQPSPDATGQKQLHQPGLGSGVIVSTEGHVLTNFHVIKKVEGIEVTIHTGESHRASIIGSDPLLDIAVLKIDSDRKDFPALAFGDSDEIMVGHSILAAGNPLGLSGTVTRGMVSAKERNLTDGAPSLIQTDAVINPGSSGGPIVNRMGEIIGITVAIYKGGKEASGWQGVALALPSNPARETYEAILQRGRPLFGYLGITVGREIVSGGIAITGIVAGSPAADATLELGDLLVEFDGIRQKSARGFLAAVLRTAPGKKVKLVVLRDEQEMALEAIIKERPSETADPSQGPTDAAITSIRKALGIRIRNLTKAELLRAGTFPTSPGVFVTAIDPESPFSPILGEGDMIVQIDNLPVGDVNSLWNALSMLPSGTEAMIYVVANGKIQALKFVPRDMESRTN